MTELNKAGLEAARFAYEAPTLWDRAPTVRLQAAILAYLNALPDHIADASTMLPPAVGTVEPVAFDLDRFLQDDSGLPPFGASPPVTVTSGVGVRKLEWVKYPTHDIWRVDCMLGTYKVYAITDKIWTFDGYEGKVDSGDCTSAEDGFQICQAHFDAAIRSTLLPVEEATGDRNDVLEEAATAIGQQFVGAKGYVVDIVTAIRALKSTPTDRVTETSNIEHVGSDVFEPTEAEVEGWKAMQDALTKIIDMNVQYAQDRWGDPSKAEDMACVQVARAALKAAHMVGAV